MGSRLQLQADLEAITPHVYFQPPNNLEMLFPCIRYARDDVDVKFAGNRPYTHTKRYQVTVIDRNPDSEIPDEVMELPLCTFDRYFPADNLNHYVFTLFF